MNQDKKNMAVLKHFRKLKEGGPAKEKEKKKKSVLSYPLGTRTEQEILRESPKRYKRMEKRMVNSVERNNKKAQKEKDKRVGPSEAGKKFRKFKNKVIGNIKINSRNRKAKRSNAGKGQGGGCVNGKCT